MDNKKIKQLVVNAMFIALLVVSSYIAIPINNISFTFQLLVVFLIVLLLDIKNSFIVLVIYLLMGLIGLPVYSGFTSGITPSFGFIIGFTTVPIIHYFLNIIIKIKNTSLKYFIISIINLIIIDIIGTIYFIIYMQVDIITALSITVFPFVLIDILKIIISIIVSKRIKEYV